MQENTAKAQRGDEAANASLKQDRLTMCRTFEVNENVSRSLGFAPIHARQIAS
jgi:hypothetical protein